MVMKNLTCLGHTDQQRKISWRGKHFDLKEGHLEGRLALNEAFMYYTRHQYITEKKLGVRT